MKLNRALPLLIAGCCVSAVSQSPRIVITGSVIDSSTNEPLVAATIRVLNSSRGTITNSEGGFVLEVPAGSSTLTFSYLAHESDTLSAVLHTDTSIVVRLGQEPIRFPEILVLAEDPAIEIIRKAIAHKRSWMGRLTSYSFDAFTRQVLYRDTSIASIMESYTSGYFKGGDTLREIVRQKRQTQNIPPAENLASVRRIVNFNEDEVSLFSFNADGSSAAFTFVGPTAPNALEYYDYTLIQTSRNAGVDVYTIRMTPKTRLRPLFNGTITIADRTFAVMGVDVRPNEAFTIPFVHNMDLEYRQQFALYDSTFWLPTDVRIKGGFNLGIVGLSLPRVGIDVVSTMYDYEVNTAIPDSILHKPRLSVDSSSAVTDSAFWRGNQVLPLSGAERRAYRTLDSTRTLEKQFAPGGPLSVLGGGGTKVLDAADIRFNRVEGLHLGADVASEPVREMLGFGAGAGYGLQDKRFTYRVRGTMGSLRRLRVEGSAEWYSTLGNTPDAGFYPPSVISITSLLFRNDYRDYYLRRGWSVAATGRILRRLETTIGWVSEQDFSLASTTNFGIFARPETYRSNPPVREGEFRSLFFGLLLGRPADPVGLVHSDALELSLETSSPGLTGSEYSFTRYGARLSWHINTFAADMMFPPVLRFSASGGVGTGDLPPQRTFWLESASSSFAPFGVLRGSGVKEFGGDRFVMVTLEHNFRNIPFLALDLPFLYRNGVELVAGGALAQSWGSPGSGGWYGEAGVGLSRLFDLFRIDATYRMKEPRGIKITFGLATIF